jgi:small-conductance mechanosensitive channel
LREFGDHALHFLLIFWIPDVREGRNGPQSDVMVAILEKFRKAGIEIPNPTAHNKLQNLLQ